MVDYLKYLTDFERKVIVEGVRRRRLGKWELVPIRPGKLSATTFGVTIGLFIPTMEPLAVNYYGHYKKSVGFEHYIAKEIKDLTGSQLRMYKSTVVHFASIGIEEVAAAGNDMLTAKFPEFKDWILKLRGFKSEAKHNYSPGK